jgi:hypothetical protein
MNTKPNPNLYSRGNVPWNKGDQDLRPREPRTFRLKAATVAKIRKLAPLYPSHGAVIDHAIEQLRKV